MDKIDILSNLSQIRKVNKITQKEVACELKVTPLTFSRWERGERDMPSSMLVKFVEYLGYRLGIFKI